MKRNQSILHVIYPFCFDIRTMKKKEINTRDSLTLRYFKTLSLELIPNLQSYDKY